MIASPCISSGVCSRLSKAGAANSPITVKIIPEIAANIIAVCISQSTSFVLLAPTTWDTATLVPAESPVKIPTRHVTRRLLAPTAAEAFVPTKLPTKIRSVVL